MAAKSKTRLRKVACPDCGYTVRMARSWMERGLPVCPCGETMRPTEPADLAFVGLIGQEDCPAPLWTTICRENGWEDLIVRRGAAGKSWTFRRQQLRSERADHCAHPGCGLWVKQGETHCAQHSPVVAAMPF